MPSPSKKQWTDRKANLLIHSAHRAREEMIAAAVVPEISVQKETLSQRKALKTKWQNS